MSINSVVNDVASSVSIINAQKPLPPTISGYSVGGLDDTALDPAGGQTVQINGTGFLAGATITFDGNAVAVVTYVSPNQLTFTSPAKSAGTYTIYVVNADGGTAIYIPGIIYSLLPTWTTSAGTLGSYYETTSISNTVVASGDAPITYSLFSGSLPTGSTLYANGVITGTAPVDSSSTTYSFTIEAIDAQLQGSTRSFSLTINVDAVTWVSPANNTTYTSAVDSAIANVALSATDAAGYAVSYSANALPTGLSLTGSNIAGTPTVIADSSTLLTATAATTNRTAVRTINWSITVANDVYFEYNTLLIPGASTTFVDDASTNNFAVTINGDTKPNSFNPYTPGYYSNYFDGNGDYLTTQNNAAFNLASNNFTIEAFFYTGSTSDQVIISAWNTTSFEIIYFSGTLYCQTNSSAPRLTTSTWPLNQWNHIAFVRSGNTYSAYLNGTRFATATDSQSVPNINAAPTIGVRQGGTSFPFFGYLSNLRVVNGTAVYDPTLTTLTVPSTPLTAIANTSLLTCQSNRFIDNSTNNFTLTVAGNTSISSFDPFVPNSSYSTYGSGYFDGTGDYLTAPSNAAFGMGTGDFTVESWVFPTAYSGSDYDTIFDFRSSGTQAAFALFYNSSYVLQAYDGPSNTLFGSGTLQRNTWNHVALTRSGTTWTLWLNGVSQGTRTSGNNLGSSQPVYISTAVDSPGVTRTLIGYQSNFRVVKGTAVYTTTFTPPATPLTAIANTSLLTLQNNQSVNNSVFLDNSTNNFFVTRNGNTTQGTFSPYGANWSNYFDGTGDFLSIPSTTALQFGTGDFTVESWVYLTATPSFQFAQIIGRTEYGTNADWMLQITNANKLTFYLGSTASFIVTSTGSVSLNTWTHVAATRSGNSFKLFINGVVDGTTTNSGSTEANGSGAYTIGADQAGDEVLLTGYLSNIRVVKGTAVYTSNFTPSTTPLTPIANTSLLTCQSNRIIDTSINNFTITKNGDVSVQRFSPFNPSIVTPTSYSGYFDGTGDYLNTPSNAAFGFGTGDFTIEAWYYFTGTIGTYQRPWWFGDDNDNIEINGSVLRVGGASQGTLITGGTTILANTWYHVALTRASGSYKLWLNGTQQGSTASNSYNSSARTFTIMATSGGSNPSTGYVSNVRIVKGVAVYTGAFTVPTSPLAATQSSGTNIAAITGTSTSLLTLQSTTFIDNSTNNFTITAFGNSQPTQQNPFGFTSATTNGYTVSTIGGSGYFDGTGDYLNLGNQTALHLGSGSYTVEMWLWKNTNASYMTACGDLLSIGTNTWQIIGDVGGTKICWYDGASSAFTITSNATIPLNAWTHIAFVRNSTTLTLYINGVSDSSTTLSVNYNASTSFFIGHTPELLTGRYWNGYISDLRMVKGTALYTSNFVPPSAPLTAVQNTSLLTNMTSAGVYDAAMMNNMETVGNAKLSTAVAKFGGSSMAFDGSSTCTILASPNLNFGTGDFTIEMWVYSASQSSTGNRTIGNGAGAGWGANKWIFTTTTPGNANKFSWQFWNYNSGGADLLVSSSASNNSTWTYVAITRSGNTFRMFVNGVIEATATSSASVDGNIPAQLTLGNSGVTGDSNWTGYLDDLRITKGYARYTSNFTPPTSAFPIY